MLDQQDRNALAANPQQKVQQLLGFYVVQPGRWFIQAIIWALVAVLLLLLWSISTPARAQDDFHFSTGEIMQHTVSVCLYLEDAKKIAKADQAGGFEAAEKVWQATETCQSFPVQCVAGGKVVFSVPIKRKDGPQVLKIVEIVGSGKNVLGYFLTTREVRPFVGREG